MMEDKECEKSIPGRLDSTQLDALVIACGILKKNNKKLINLIINS